MKVLVVEDDPFYSQVIAERLADRSLDVEVVHTAQDALKIDTKSIHCAVIDIMLPNDPDQSGITELESRGGFSTGLCVARRLLASNPNIRIVILTSDVVDTEAERWADEHTVPFIRKHEGWATLLRALKRVGSSGSDQKPLAFIVHGQDEVALLELKNYIQNTLGWEQPLILREQPNSGKTLIEKFEEFQTRIDYVFVLLSPDDRVFANEPDSEKRRSRQNVIFELGFFYGALGRQSGHILLLYRGGVELPSDIAGVAWIDISKGVEAAGEAIRRELRTFGVEA